MKRYIIAIILCLLIFGSAAAQVRWYRTSEIGAEFYLDLDGRERGAFLMGYLVSAYVWSTGIYEASQFDEGWTGPVAHIYNLLTPITDYRWTELDNAVLAYYRNHPTSDTPIWEILHTFADERKPNYKENF